MSNDPLWSIVEKESGNVSKNISYSEYYLDILGTVLSELVSCVDQTKITSELQAKIDVLNQILKYSSIDMNRLSDTDQTFKVSGIIELKNTNAQIRQLYLNKLFNK